jgi:hypothetical protein
MQKIDEDDPDVKAPRTYVDESSHDILFQGYSDYSVIFMTLYMGGGGGIKPGICPPPGSNFGK